MNGNNVVILFGGLWGLPTPSASDPDVDFTNWTDRVTSNQLHHSPVIVAGVNLGTHLGGYLGSCGDFTNDPRLPNVISEWLLAVDMFFEFQRGQRGKGVGVFAGADDHGIEFLFDLVQFPEIRIAFGLGKLLLGGVQGDGRNVADRHNVFAFANLREIPSPASPNPDDGDVEFLVQILGAEQGRSGEPTGGGER